MEYELRKATADDFARINELFVEMLNAVYHDDNSSGYENGALDYYFSNGEDWICAAEVNGEVAAFLSIEVHRDENEGSYLYYDDFCVGRAYRNNGIGSALIDEAERFAKSNGIYEVILHVEKENLSALSFYEKRGFTILRQENTRLRMIKILSL